MRCGGGTEASQALRRGGNLCRVGVDTRSCFPWDGRSPVSHPTCDVPFPPKEDRQISERDDLGPHVVPGGQEIGLWDSKTVAQGGGTSHGASRLDWDGQVVV
jgi:hypothetical protein